MASFPHCPTEVNMLRSLIASALGIILIIGPSKFVALLRRRN